MAAFRKRVVAMKKTAPVKTYPVKQQFKRKRRSRSTSFTSKSGAGNSFGYRSKKLGLKAYRNILWKDSIMKTKWRTCQAFSQNLTSPLNSARVSIGIFDAFGNTGSPFWTVGGGTLAADNGTPVPTFNGDIVVRGGVLGIRITNQDADTQPQQIKVMLFRTVDKQAIAPPAVTEQPVGFDMTILTDFTQFYGRPLMSKVALIENNNVVEFKYRLKVHKVDQYQFSQIAKRYFWMVSLGSTANSSGTTATVTQYWNASFAADST